MFHLLTVSFIWAFSFGLIGNTLAGVDPWFLALARLSISLLVFLPFMRMKDIGRAERLRLVSIGAVQYGAMYTLLFFSFNYLESHEVALFTIFTPIYVTLLNDVFTRKFHPIFFAVAALAVFGTGIIKYDRFASEGVFAGFVLMQGSNICFALGQIWYRNTMRRMAVKSNSSVFALLYLGGVSVALLFALPWADWGAVRLDSSQLGVLIYLGAVASGLGFFLWNVGARRVDAGTLAVFNNIKIPLAIAVSILVFGERTNLVRLTAGLIVIVAALLLNRFHAKSSPVEPLTRTSHRISFPKSG